MKNIVYKIKIKGSLTDLNTFISSERKNKFEGAKVKRQNTDFVMWQTKGLEPIRHYPLHVHMLWLVKDSRKDPDNIAFAKKFILDALVENRILEDDGQKQIKSFSDEFEIDKNEGVIITLTHRKKRV